MSSSDRGVPVWTGLHADMQAPVRRVKRREYQTRRAEADRERND